MKANFFIFLTFLILAVGCVTPKISGIPDTMTLDEPQAFSMPAASPEPRPEEQPFPEPVEPERFSLSVRDADIRDVLLLLSKDSGTNIIADKDVTGTLSVDFSDLDLKSALFAITRPLGYTFWPDSGFIMVSKPVLITKAFSINYITGKRTYTSTMNAAITSQGSSGGIYASTGASLDVSGLSGTGSSAAGQGNVKVTTSGTTDFWEEIRKGLEVLIFGDSKGGSATKAVSGRADTSGKKLVINKLAGIAYITDYSDNMERITSFLNDIEVSVRKQVMIQAHIIEISLNDDFKFGIDWDTVAGGGTGVQGELIRFSQGLVLNPLTDIFQVEISNKKITALLDAMSEQGQVNVLSSPKISIMNNQKAVIKLSTREVSWVTNSFLNADGSVLYTYTNPQVDEVGLFLDVTPQIDNNGVVTMQIHPNVSEKIGDSISPDGKSSKPVIQVREVDTIVKVRNGQTIVIAGLITDKIIEITRKVPLLGDIPIIGQLFTQTVQKKQKSELVILITPYLLNDRSIEEIRKEHEERLNKAGRFFSPVSFTRKDLNRK